MTEAPGDAETLPRPPEVARDILARRAAALARRGEQAGARVASAPRCLVVAVGGERLGIDVERVTRVVTGALVSWLPGAPPFVAGALCLHGVVLTLVDLGLLLGVASTATPGDSEVVVVRLGPSEVGLAVTRVEGVLEARGVTPFAPPRDAWLTLDHVRGVTEDGWLSVDIERILEDPRAQVA